MKKLALLLLIAIGLAQWSPNAIAKDKKEDYWKKEYKETRDDVRELNDRYDQVKEQLRKYKGSRSAWAQLQVIHNDVERINWLFERRAMNYHDLRDRVKKVRKNIERLDDQVRYERRRY